MNTDLNIYYENLLEIRELFHSIGKIEDSNAKLDEIVKYLSIFIYTISQGDNYYKNFKNNINLALQNPKNLNKLLQKEFLDIQIDTNFQNNKGNNIYAGETLITNEDDHLIVCSLLSLLLKVFENQKEDNSLDLINEIFGTFIRDNFRSNVEDAQFLTPIEAVDFSCKLSLLNASSNNSKESLIVADPFCGVGSFLERFHSISSKLNKNVKLIGQDKMDRMSRFAHINFLLSRIKKEDFNLSVGDSYSGNSPIDEYKGKVDLILTNPPFGADINIDGSREYKEDFYPFIHDLLDSKKTKISSESVSISRCISLLKPGGQLSIVVPDSVVSSYGISKTIRSRLSSSEIELVSVVALPSVTFAQAGTMTKTHLVTFNKNKSRSKNVFFAISDEIGFKVKTKKGIKIKISEGSNDLIKIAEAFEAFTNGKTKKVLSSSPSATLIQREIIADDFDWTPSHFGSKRLNAMEYQQKKLGEKFDLYKLSEVVDFLTEERKKEEIEKSAKFISILHIVDSKSLDFDAIKKADMKDQGIKCYPGDLIFSKINPRIPRALVVPNLDFPVSCSSEFEILRAKKPYNNFYIKFILLQKDVQSQILSMTSGTSASHNRIRSDALRDIMLPIPKKTSSEYKKIDNLVKIYTKHNKELFEVEKSIFKAEEDLGLFFR